MPVKDTAAAEVVPLVAGSLDEAVPRVLAPLDAELAADQDVVRTLVDLTCQLASS